MIQEIRMKNRRNRGRNRGGMMRKTGRIIGVVMLTGSLFGCALPTPYENFKDSITSDIGRSLDDPRIQFFYLRQTPLQVVSLQNGHDEYHYKLYYRGRDTCRYMIEVDPSARIIVNTRWEGTEEDCGIVP
jgi:hypothetical protein